MKQELTFDDGIFIFETVMRVRNAETGIGQQLTLESLTALLTEAQTRFLHSKDIEEIDTEYRGLIFNSMQLNIVSHVCAREELLFELGIEKVLDEGGDMVIKVSRMYDGSLVAKARKHFIHYDYRSNQTIPLNSSVKEALDQQPLMILDT